MTAGHRWLRWGAGTALMAVIALCLLGAARMSHLDALAIDWVEVRGSFERVTAEQVRTAAAPHLEQGFIAVDPEGVRAAVERLPWVRSAQVSKRWPDTVVIAVTENHPVARWHDGRLVSDGGRLFSVGERFPANGLPVLGGSDGQVAEIVDFYRMAQLRLAGSGLDVRELERSSRGSWRAVLSGDIVVELGSDDPLPRLVRFIAALKRMELGPGQQLRSVDLRYANGFALTWAHDGELVSTGDRQ